MVEIYFWKTQNGESYKYWVYELPIYFYSESLCNYVFCKKNGNEYDPILIGEGPIQKVTDLNFHALGNKLKKYGVTHIHVHNSVNETLRLNEVEELINCFGNKIC